MAAGRVLGLNGEQLAHALGIAGSLSSGILAFTKSRAGAMVKRLHLGRAAESGVLAARLAAAGYTGPETILEGKFGFLETYCRDADRGALTAGLNETWETLLICIKRYACHLYAHTPISALRSLMSEHGFSGGQVAHIAIEGSKRLLSHHDIREPADITKAQYSVPFCVALSLFRDPEDPRAFDTGALQDTEIRAACRDVELRLLGQGEGSPRVTHIHVSLKDGRELRARVIPSKACRRTRSAPPSCAVNSCACAHTSATPLLPGLPKRWKRWNQRRHSQSRDCSRHGNVRCSLCWHEYCSDGKETNNLAKLPRRARDAEVARERCGRMIASSSKRLLQGNAFLTQPRK